MELERGLRVRSASRVTAAPEGARVPARDRYALRNLVIASGLASSLLAGCGGPNRPAPTPTRTPTSSSSSRSSATSAPTPNPPSNLKPLLRGLLDRSGIPPAGFEQVMGGYVVTAYWSDLQPNAGGPIAANNVIDQAVAQVRASNATNGTRWGLRLRLYAGIHAPDWAKHLGGDPVSVTDPQSGRSGSIGRFWTPEFGTAYDQLQAALAARYDTTPELRDVTISRCTTVYAEPLIRDTRDPTTVSALLAAGYTVAADEQCQRDAITAHGVWQHTRSALALNPYQAITPDDRGRVDEGFTEQLMADCRTVLAARCILENNSLRTDPAAAYEAMYRAMQQHGGAISFQTATMARVGDLSATLEMARQLGATSVEVPAGYAQSGAAQYKSSSAGLAANAPNG